MLVFFDQFYDILQSLDLLHMDSNADSQNISLNNFLVSLILRNPSEFEELLYDNPEFLDSITNDIIAKIKETDLPEEKEELIDLLVEGGWVKRTSPKGTKTEDRLPSILEIEWQDMCNKLSDIRLRISTDDEETIKNILKRY